MKSKLVLLLLIISTNVYANFFKDYSQKYNEFISIMSEAQNNGQLPPRLSNSKDAKLILALTDDKQLQTLANIPHDEFINVIAVCSRSNDIYRNYLMFRSAEGKYNSKIAEQNLKQFQNEMIQFNRFTVQCFADALPKVELFYSTLSDDEKTPVRKSGALRMKHGIIQLYTGYILLIDSDCLTLESKQRLVSILLKTTPNYVNIMSLSDRKHLINTMSKHFVSIDEKLKPDVFNIMKMLENTTCNELCLITK